MAHRHNVALTMFGNETDLRALAYGILIANDEAIGEGINPHSDPAVLLIGCQLAFVTHTDSMSRRLLQDLISACEVNSSRAQPTPSNRSH